MSDARKRFREEIIRLGGMAVGGDYVLSPLREESRDILTLDGQLVASVMCRTDLYALADICRAAIASWKKRQRVDAERELVG